MYPQFEESALSESYGVLSEVDEVLLKSKLVIGTSVAMMAYTASKKEFKWELGVISNTDDGNRLWARIKARNNREYAVCVLTEMKETYGKCWFFIDNVKLPAEPLPTPLHGEGSSGTTAGGSESPTY